MAFQINNFPAQLAQVIAASRPVFQAGGTPRQYLGTTSSSVVEGPDYTRTGREIENLGNVMIEGTERRKKDALEFVRTIGSLQGPEKDFWDTMSDEDSIQEKMIGIQKLYPEYIAKKPNGKLMVLPQSSARQAYEKGEAEIAGEKASTNLKGKQAGVLEEEKRIKAVEAKVGEMSIEDQLKYYKLRNSGMKADEAYKNAQTKSENVLRDPRRQNLLAQTGDIRSQTGERETLLPWKQEQARANERLTQAQAISEEQKTALEAEMHPLKKKYMEAQIESEIADASSKIQTRNLDYAKLQQKMENEAQDHAFRGWKAALDSIDARVQKFGELDPMEKAVANLSATYSLVNSFGKQNVQTGRDPETGEPIMFVVPGAINNAGGRYAIDQTIDRVFEGFQRLWQEGSAKSLESAMQLDSMAFNLWQDTYGASVKLTDDPKQIEAILKGLQGMPEIVGEANPTARYRELYAKIVTMQLTADSLRPNEQKEVPLDDPLRKQFRPLPPPPGRVWGTKFKVYRAEDKSKPSEAGTVHNVPVQ